MAAVITELKADLPIPFGVDILCDPIAPIGLAHAVGASSCARSSAAPTRATSGSGARIRPPLSYRRQIGADAVKLFFNVTAEVATPIAPRDIGLTAKSAVFSSLAEAVCVSGGITGSEVDAEQLRRAKAAVGDGAAVIANTGVRPQTVGEMLGLADGCIVGTSLKREGNTWNEVDGERVERLVAAAAESGLWSTGGEAR